MKKVLLLPLVICTLFLNLNYKPSVNSLTNTYVLVSSNTLALLTELPFFSSAKRTALSDFVLTTVVLTKSLRKTGIHFHSFLTSSIQPARLVFIHLSTSDMLITLSASLKVMNGRPLSALTMAPLNG